MAIYSPTFCEPFLDTYDIDKKPFYLKCKIDSSNTMVDAISITIRNSDNQIVFPTSDQTTTRFLTTELLELTRFLLKKDEDENTHIYKDLLIARNNNINLNTGINGSILMVPLAIDVNDLSKFPEDKNIKSYLQEFNNSNVLKNGQSYTWTFTLYQLKNREDNPTATAEEVKFFDMPVTVGAVMGSNDTRIQTLPFTTNLLDKYIQPIYINNLNINYDNLPNWNLPSNISIGRRGNKVLISSVDNSFNYIYPATGSSGFLEGTIVKDRYNAFQIFENGDVSYGELPENKKVSLMVEYFSVPFVSLVQNETDGAAGTWVDLPATPENSYGVQQYLEDKTFWNNHKNEFYPFAVTFSSGSWRFDSNKIQSYGYKLTGDSSERILLNHQNYIRDGENVKVRISSPSQKNPSPFNGIYKPSFTVNENYSSDDVLITVNWYRTPDANIWGDLINKTVKVNPSQKQGSSGLATNYAGQYVSVYSQEDIDAFEYDNQRINYTDILFKTEKPVSLGIYSGQKKDEYGLILYNQIASQANKSSFLFIRPFDGLENGMLFEEQKVDSNNRFLIDNINKELWYIKYTQTDELLRNFSPVINKTRYQIKTNFRTSEENPFTLSKTPELEIVLWSLQQEADSSLILQDNNLAYKFNKLDDDTFVLSQRNFLASGNYKQDNNISWKNYQWSLYDENNQEIELGDIGYDQLIEQKFYGLIGVEGNITLDLENMFVKSWKDPDTAGDNTIISIGKNSAQQLVITSFNTGNHSYSNITPSLSNSFLLWKIDENTPGVQERDKGTYTALVYNSLLYIWHFKLNNNNTEEEFAPLEGESPKYSRLYSDDVITFEPNYPMYTLKLAVETYEGYVVEKTIKILTDFTEDVTVTYPVEVSFDCNKAAVDITTINNGVVLPSWSGETQDNLLLKNKEVSYNKIAAHSTSSDGVEINLPNELSKITVPYSATFDQNPSNARANSTTSFAFAGKFFTIDKDQIQFIAYMPEVSDDLHKDQILYEIKHSITGDSISQGFIPIYGYNSSVLQSSFVSKTRSYKIFNSFQPSDVVGAIRADYINYGDYSIGAKVIPIFNPQESSHYLREPNNLLPVEGYFSLYGDEYNSNVFLQRPFKIGVYDQEGYQVLQSPGPGEENFKVKNESGSGEEDYLVIGKIALLWSDNEFYRTTQYESNIKIAYAQNNNEEFLSKKVALVRRKPALFVTSPETLTFLGDVWSDGELFNRWLDGDTLTQEQSNIGYFASALMSQDKIESIGQRSWMRGTKIYFNLELDKDTLLPLRDESGNITQFAAYMQLD